MTNADKDLWLENAYALYNIPSLYSTLLPCVSVLTSYTYPHIYHTDIHTHTHTPTSLSLLACSAGFSPTHFGYIHEMRHVFYILYFISLPSNRLSEASTRLVVRSRHACLEMSGRGKDGIGRFEMPTASISRPPYRQTQVAGKSRQACLPPTPVGSRSHY